MQISLEVPYKMVRRRASSDLESNYDPSEDDESVSSVFVSAREVMLHNRRVAFLLSTFAHRSSVYAME